jgi:hypothetical protein
MPLPIAFHGKKLLQALEAEGIIPPGWRAQNVSLDIDVNEAVKLHFDVLFSGEDALKLQRALAWLLGEAIPKDSET